MSQHIRFFIIQQKLTLRFHIWNTQGHAQIYYLLAFFPLSPPLLISYSPIFSSSAVANQGQGSKCAMGVTYPRGRGIFWFILCKLPVHGNNKRQTTCSWFYYCAEILYHFYCPHCLHSRQIVSTMPTLQFNHYSSIF